MLSIKNHTAQILKTILPAHTGSAGAVWHHQQPSPPTSTPSKIPKGKSFIKWNEYHDILLQAGTHTSVQIPPPETGFLWKHVPSCPTAQESQGPSLCFPSFPPSIIFSPRITSFPFSLSRLLCMHCHKTMVWTARGHLSPVLGPLCLSRVAPGGRRKDRRKRKKKQWFGSYQWPPPVEAWGNANKRVALKTSIC